jgi:DoxX-like family
VSTASAIVSILLAALLLASAAIKITRREPYVQGYLKVGVPEERLNQLALLLIAGAGGLLLGLAWAPIGIAAAACLVVYFALAIAAHLRADDFESLPVPVAMEMLALAALVLEVV